MANTPQENGAWSVFYVLAILLLLSWGGCWAFAYTFGGWIHALFVVAIVMILMEALGGKKEDEGKK